MIRVYKYSNIIDRDRQSCSACFIHLNDLYFAEHKGEDSYNLKKCKPYIKSMRHSRNSI
jgi:hypothetical protein